MVVFVQAVGTGVVTGTKAVGSGQFANSIFPVENLPEKNRNGGWVNVDTEYSRDRLPWGSI